jgi:hypothetical protein
MRGRNFHTYSFDRVITDIRDAKTYGARTIFLVEDNITLMSAALKSFAMPSSTPGSTTWTPSLKE